MNIIAVDEKILYRGPRPMIMEDWKAVQQVAKTILNLESGTFELLHNAINEETITAIQNSLIPIHLLLGDVLRPTESELRWCVELIQMPIYQPVYVHCLHGVDRTGLVCAAYRMIVMNWTKNKAVSEMKELGFHTMPYEPWISVLDNFADDNR